MATGKDVIERAFSKAGIRPAETPLQASEISDGLDILNDLIAQWGAVSILKGVPPLADVNDVILAPPEAIPALKANVTILLAGEYGTPVSQSMAHGATESLAFLITSAFDIETPVFSDTLPQGSGNTEGYEYTYFDYYDGKIPDNF
jgi:hypothetical protein